MDCAPPRTTAHLTLLTYGTGVVYMRRGAVDLQRRIATPLLGATTAARPTGCLTTTPVATTAPPVATQPARYTPRAQTTALASIVLKAVKPPNSNIEMITRFIALLLGVAMEPHPSRPDLGHVCAKLLTSSASFMSGTRRARPHPWQRISGAIGLFGCHAFHRCVS